MAETRWGLRSHVYQGLEFFCSSCVLSSWNKTMCKSFVARGDIMQQPLFVVFFSSDLSPNCTHKLTKTITGANNQRFTKRDISTFFGTFNTIIICQYSWLKFIKEYIYRLIFQIFVRMSRTICG